MPSASFGKSIDAAKGSFFDSPKVMRAVDAARRKVLSKFGAFVRTRSRSSIRRAPAIDPKTGQKTRRSKRKPTIDAVAEQGKPPFSHAGLLRQFILFGYDFQTKSVVIGPTKLNSKRGGGAEFLERGGDTTIRIGKDKTPKPAHFKGNPFMQPAFDAELPGFLDLLKDSVTPEGA